jgi:uncharacterized protein
MAKRVIDERITPRFRAGDFYGGIRDGVDQLIRLAEGEKLPAPPPAAPRRAADFDPVSMLFWGIVAAAVLGGVLKAMLGRFPGSIATGGALGLLAWLLFGAAIAVIAAVVAFIFTYANTGVGRGGGWSSGSGGSWGGSSGGSSSSWGGGGGGSFGGGGSSGSW